MEISTKYLEILSNVHKLLREAEDRLGVLLDNVSESTFEEFDDVCDILNAAGAKLRYVRVFVEPAFDDSEDTLS